MTRDAARTDKMAAATAARPLDVAILDAMAPEQAEAAVRKDAVWPTPDWRDLVASGVEPRAAALIKIVRDRLPTRPDYRKRQLGTHYTQSKLRDAAALRRDYVRMLSLVRDTLMACRTADDVRAARGNILAALGWTPEADAELRHLVTSVWRDRLDTLQVDYRDSAAAETMLRSGWPGAAVPNWRRGWSVSSDGDGGFMLVHGIRVVQDGFASEEAAWDWLRVDTEARRANEPPKPPMPSRPLPETLLRSGLPERRAHHISERELVETFGLRAIEFGKWVTASERRDLTNKAFDALHDLAQVLGIAPAAIGLGGTLSLSFGARAAGHYDASLRAIALPRLRGDGRLASSWAKAFDHWSGDPEATARWPRFASGRSAPTQTAAASIPTPETQHLTAEEVEAWRKLTDAIWRKRPDIAEEAVKLRADIAKREAQVAEAEEQRKAFVAAGPAAFASPEGRRYLQDLDRWLRARRESVLPRMKAHLADFEAAARIESAFATEAHKLCGRDGDYWKRPGEMFARAFEAFVTDRLAASGAANSFLVHGADQGRFSMGYRGDPYPAADERHRIDAAMAGLVDAMTPRLEAAGLAMLRAAELADPEESLAPGH